MKRKLNLLLIPFILFLSNCNKSDSDIINQTISALNSLKTIEYQQISHFKQKQTGTDALDSALCYFDFTSKDTLLGAKYHFIARETERVFNGNQTFFLWKEENKVIYIDEPKLESVKSSMFTLNSIYVLRKVLPAMIKDTSIIFIRLNDTIISNQNCYSFLIKMKNKMIDMITDSIKEEKSSTNIFLAISDKSYLPVQFKTINAKNDFYLKTTFDNLNTSVVRADSIWSYERFPKEYLRMSWDGFVAANRAKTSVNVGKDAPRFTLPLLNGDSIKLSDQKGKLVLLEFWYLGCGPCMLAIPTMNEMQKKYKGSGLNVFGIECVNSNNQLVEEHVKKHKTEYPNLWNGKEVSKEYGITAAPTFFLINRKGKIVYSNIGLNKEDLTSAIEKNL